MEKEDYCFGEEEDEEEEEKQARVQRKDVNDR